MIALRVTWDTIDCECGQPVPDAFVSVPEDVYFDGMTSWDDPVSDWLSEHFGFLVMDWQLA